MITKKTILHFVFFVFIFLCFFSNVYAGTLTDVSVSADNYVVGEKATYTFSYTIETGNPQYVFYISLPEGFSASDTGIKSFTINGSPVEIYEFGIDFVGDHKLRVEATPSSLATASANIIIELESIRNASVVGIHNFGFFRTVDSGLETIDETIAPSVEITEAFEEAGTEEDPYQISNCQDLQFMRSNNGAYLDNYFILTDNIDCGGTNPGDEDFDESGLWRDGSGFNSVGSEEINFTGNFDGNDKNINNLYIYKSDDDYIGLFGHVSNSAVIKDLSLINFDIEGDEYVGALVGRADEDVSIDNISVTGVFDGSYGVGGIAGISKGIISNSSSDIEINAGSRYAGGIAGILSGVEDNLGLISNSHSTGTINVNEVGGGGLVGLSQTYTAITDSYSSSNVVAGWKAGGLVGVAEGNISDCYATGAVSSIAYGAGGLVGYLKGGFVNSSYATGNISAGSDSIGIDTNSSYAGGLVGLANNGAISESYATGNVTGASIRVGGLVGGTNSSIENSYATGDVQGTDRVGGLVGGITGNIINSYSIGKVTATGEWIINEEDEDYTNDGGGGGGGYFGGEGGQSDASPGAGGSGYLHPSLVSAGVLTNGNNGEDSDRALSPNTSDENYVEGVGLGGNENLNSGNGLIYIDYNFGNTTFSYTGDSQTFTVPSGVTSIDVKIWGAGGGGSDYDEDDQGGSGGYAGGTITVTPGQILVIIIGGGGGQGVRNIIGGLGGYGGGGYGTRGDASGGGGGGLSGIFKNDNGTDFESLTQSDAIIIAGGGGGGTGYSGPGGAGGGENGNDGEGYSVSCGGSQVAGGSCLENGDDGSALRGGNGDETGIRGTSELLVNYDGGLIGYNTGSPTNSYWDTETSEYTESNGGAGKTTSQMKNQNTFIDWDFENVWKILSGGYPCFKWQDVCPVEDEEDSEQPEPEIRRILVSGSSAGSRYKNLLTMGKKDEADKLAKEFPSLISNIEVSKFIFTKNLKSGIINDEVKELQKFLNNNNYILAISGQGSKGYETNKFGQLTKKALIKFQIANKLKGDGIVGPLTRRALNSF